MCNCYEFSIIYLLTSGGSKEINCYDDIERFKQSTGCTSVMLARAAQWNVSIFRKQGLYSVDQVIHDYLKYVNIMYFVSVKIVVWKKI